MKKIVKLIALVLALASLTMVITGCGTKTGEAVVFTGQEYERQISDYGTDWVFTKATTLTVFPDNTYMLTVVNNAVGYQDIAGRGDNTTVYFGKYTSAENAELGEGFVDYVLEPATRVTYHQHMQMGLYFGGEYVLDSAAKDWSEELIEATGYESAAAFLEAKAQGFTITVETAKGLINNIQ